MASASKHSINLRSDQIAKSTELKVFLELLN